jgi:hypothetical protein
VEIEMRLHPPGPEGEPIELRTQATIPSASKVGRWIRQGKLPEPKRGISGMLLFPKDFQMPSEM